MEKMMLKTLKNHFGYDSFRPRQEEIIRHVLDKKDALVLMPTGGGKSLCYQIPALLLPGIAIVVSPLISLMKDQVESLQANGIAAAALNSNNDEETNMHIRQECRLGHIKLLYISPERLVFEMQSLLPDLELSLFAIDEAHCISQWGHDFRPDYKQLGSLREAFPHVPMIALTATADKLTREDILNQLKMNHPRVFVSSFDRPNLSLDVKRGYNEKERMSAIQHFIGQHPGDSGIIYCMTRKLTEKVADKLRLKGLQIGVYHAGLPAEERNRVQEDFIHDRTQIICATVAFGMGIDKSNVRWVIHNNLPKSIESFYQEIGRAGRDGLPSDTLLFYSLQDIVTLTQFAGNSGQQKLNTDKLRRMQEYAEAQVCRRRILLNYFGENSECRCGNCDICKNPPKQFDGTILVQKALSAMVRTNEQTSTSTMVDILKGHYSPEVVKHGYDKLKTFGAGRDVPGRDWFDYLLQMLQLGYYEIAYNEDNHLKITPLGKQVLFGEKQAMLSVINRKEEENRQTSKRKTKTPAPTKQTTPSMFADDGQLFELLRTLRKRLADEQGYPAYIVVNDRVLRLLATHKPTTVEAFGEIPGIGEFKKQKYGKEFTDTIKRFMNA